MGGRFWTWIDELGSEELSYDCERGGALFEWCGVDERMIEVQSEASRGRGLIDRRATYRGRCTQVVLLHRLLLQRRCTAIEARR